MLIFIVKQLSFFIFICSVSFAGCIQFSEAPQHVGEARCVKGKVLYLDESNPGFMRFCRGVQKCAFTTLVAVTPETAPSFQELQGKTIKVRGLVKDFNGDAQIILPDSRQLFYEDSDIPSFMRTYDVEEHGHYSPGTSRAPKTKHSSTKKQAATLPIDIPVDNGLPQD